VEAMSRDCSVQKLYRRGERPVAGRVQRFEGRYTEHVSWLRNPVFASVVLKASLLFFVQERAQMGAEIGAQPKGSHLEPEWLPIRWPGIKGIDAS